jgi:regulator of protease activity HflC (stomatin/prohibitin superfamily)
MKTLWFIGALVIFLLIAIISTFGIVNSWEIWIKYSYWTIESTIPEWTYLLTPFVESVDTIDIKTQKLEVESISASKDLQTITTEVTLNYSVDPKLVMSLYRNIWKDFIERVVQPTMQEAIKSSTAKYTAEELITKRELVKQWIKLQVSEKLNPIWIRVEDINITNFAFSPEFDQAVNQKVKAEQEALTQKNKLEQVKYEAQQTIEKAKAQAESIRIQAQSISAQGWDQYVKLKLIDAWASWWAKVPTYMSSGNWENFLLNIVK